MARDYKNVTEAATQKKKSRMTSKKTIKNATAEKTLPGWVWLVSGVVIGGFVSFIVYLKLSVPIEGSDNASTSVEQIQSEKVQEERLKEKLKEKKQPEPKTPAAQIKSQKQVPEGELEFYKILTNRDALFPDNKDEKKTELKNKEAQTKKIVAPEPTVKAATDSLKTKKIAYIYTLQIGSFLKFKDADKRKADLAMLGIGSRIHAIKARHVTYYRVMVGPYDDIKRVQKIESEMKANNIKTLLLRERG